LGGWLLELEQKQALKFSFGLGLCNILQAYDNKEENLERKKRTWKKKERHGETESERKEKEVGYAFFFFFFLNQKLL
jgi:hypothetical protein